MTHPLEPDDNLALVDAAGAGLRGAARRRASAPAALRRALRRRAGRDDGRRGGAQRRVLYLIWHDPWMTVARDTYLSRMLARIGWLTLPDGDGGATGAARYPALRGDEPWLGEVERVLLSSEPFALPARATSPRRRALCPARERAARRRRAAQLVRRARRRRACATCASSPRRQCAAARVD